WMFLQFYKAGMAYKAKTKINWCLSCKIGLANEEVVNGVCERCGGEVVKRDKEQWMIAISKYAQRLLDDLDTVDYLPKIKKQQQDWIGRSEGAEVDFKLSGSDEVIRVFTTRPDTLFGATYMVLAPEHELVSQIVTDERRAEVEAYVSEAGKKTDIDRADATKEKTGVFTGAYAINPVNGKEIPVWVADYVMMGYGTGAIMAVPAHDERDSEFAKKFDLKILDVIENDIEPIVGVGVLITNQDGDFILQQRDENTSRYPGMIAPFGGGRHKGETLRESAKRELYEELGLSVDVSELSWVGDAVSDYDSETIIRIYKLAIASDTSFDVQEGAGHVVLSSEAIQLNDKTTNFTKNIARGSLMTIAWSGKGLVVNSDFLNGFSTEEAKEKITTWLTEKGLGKAMVNFKLRDWVFSRQRYWGEPIPLIKCDKCGWVPVSDDQLPVLLPEVEKYEPTDDGESPLSAIDEWVNTTCPKCGGEAKRETDTMPNWAGSSWYFLRYLDPKNNEVFADKSKIDYWMPVDLYNGGMEHTTLHLLYSRFWHKFLFDQGFVSTSEPYVRRHSHGLVLADDGHKMSKSKGNVINPDEIVDKYGADALRMYEMFMGPFEEPVPWSTNGLIGIVRFLDKVVRLKELVRGSEEDIVTTMLHKTIKKVTEDIDGLRFNTAVSQMMIFVNDVQAQGSISKDSFIKFLQILCPFAPHLSNELAEGLGVEEVLEATSWPTYDPDLIVDALVKIAVQVNGKLRAEVKASPHADQKEVEALARENSQVAKYLEGEAKKVIYVQGKLINFVV
ncbi:class I tRNA ligase family protein, partial [Patescibacteria group bacterium]|nr:class I tRNA ligase family protein [Patescibacteria group bacterium]